MTKKERLNEIKEFKNTPAVELQAIWEAKCIELKKCVEKLSQSQAEAERYGRILKKLQKQINLTDLFNFEGKK